MKLGICHLLLDYYPRTGGAEVQARRLARYQHERGHTVLVIARRRLDDAEERRWPPCELIDGVPVYRVSVWGHGRLAAVSYFLGGLWLLLRHTKKYQVIHAHMLSAPAVLGGIAGWLLGKRVVAKASGGGFQIRSNISDLQASAGQRWLLRHTLHCLLAINREIAADLERMGFPARQITYLPNGIDVQEFRPADEPLVQIRRRLGLPVEGPILVFTGRLRQVKNLATLVEAVALVAGDFPTVCLVIVGEGRERERLERCVAALELAERVRFIGEVNDVRPYLHAADLFVLPSLKEGLSNSMLEAMACGIPVVATAVGGAPDLICHGENGLLLSPNPSPEEIAAALRMLLDNLALCREMGRRARQTVVETCAFEIVGEQLLALYTSRTKQ